MRQFDRASIGAGLLVCLTTATAATVTDPAAPLGRLSDAATPTAYRLDMKIDPERPRFSGHDEIDVLLKSPTRRLYLHGRDLAVSRAVALVGGRPVAGVWSQVDRSGVARLDFPAELPAGPVTLVFDFDAAFANSATGLYRARVGERWYSWTQFEAIDARAAFPSFDEPGFKTPFTVTITTPPGNEVVSNTPEMAVQVTGELAKHTFAPTRPLPTYLVAMATGPFVRAAGQVPADAQRPQLLPFGAVATQAQAARLDYAMTETPRIVALLEDYFGGPFPFPKLDQIASPAMQGAMENAGAVIYADPLLLLDAGASTRQKQGFGSVVAHELAHQWFGDYVTPAWWSDIWLNESFADWMGYRIAHEWRPELNIGVAGLADGFAAMDIDALEAGRPIHQPIDFNRDIDSAFDGITYGKGGHVIAMIAAYLGDERFRDGVRLHMARHRYGTADSEQFFDSLADAAHDPRVLAAMKSFVDQQGVPVIDFRRAGGRWVVTQSRYAFLGSRPRPERWTIPLCLRTGAARSCSLLDAPGASVAAPAGVLMPNAGGTGYYRFELPSADWQALIAQSARLPPAEALALDDSLWASFRAGRTAPARLIDAARAMADNPDSNAAVDGGNRLAGLHARGFVDRASEPAYRRLMVSVYGPKLAALGADPAAGTHAGDPPDRQKLRQALVRLVALQGREVRLRARLAQAADAYLGGDAQALDQGFLTAAFTVTVDDGGVPAAARLLQRALTSEDAVFRRAALDAVVASGRPDVARWLLASTDARLRPDERLHVVTGLTRVAGTQALAGGWLLANYEKLVGDAGQFAAGRLPEAFANRCGADEAQRLSDALGPKVRAADAGRLDFERVVEGVRHCGVLKVARGAELTAAIRHAR